MGVKLYTCIVFLTDGSVRIRRNWANPDNLGDWFEQHNMEWKEINVYPKAKQKGEKPPCERKIINPKIKKGY